MNLRDNKKAIVSAVKKYQRAIKVGEFSGSRQRAAWNQIKSSDKKITEDDQREIKQILSHLGQGAAVKAGKVAAGQSVPVKNEKRPVPKYRQALDAGYKKYQYGGAKIGAAYIGNEKVVGIIKSEAGISASGAAGKEKIGRENLGIKKNADVYAGNAGAAGISIIKKG